MMADHFDDLDNLAIPAHALVRIPTPKEQKRRRHFIKVPWTWHEKLLGARWAATYPVAAHILYHHWKSRGEPFTLANNAIAGVTRWGKWRALAELESFGLITIERRKRRSPRITIL
jgi:hypothetical protein